MPILNRAAEMQDEIAGWRRHIHRTPELGFDLYQTADFVAARLKDFGCDEVATGIARTGVVGIIKGRLGPGPTVGLRADMDALPINETSGKPYASTVSGKMHACGHDGHTAMLLGAAKYLAETRNFAGSVAVIFQPAEEGGGGGNEMVKEGMMDRFGIDRVFGMHNMPGLPVGQFAIRPGPIMAATAEFTIRVTGKGGHAAMPHRSIDPIVAASQIVVALQTIASRTVDPAELVVVSVTKFHGGEAYNVIPEHVELAGTVRTLKKEVAVARSRAHAGDLRGHRQGERHGGNLSLSPQLPRHREQSRRDRLCGRHRRHRGGRDRDPPGHPAVDGRRGLFLHAGSAAGRLHLHRQRRHGRTSTTPPTTSTTRRSRTG